MIHFLSNLSVNVLYISMSFFMSYIIRPSNLNILSSVSMKIENAVTLYSSFTNGISRSGASCLCRMMVKKCREIPNKSSVEFPGSEGGS